MKNYMRMFLLVIIPGMGGVMSHCVYGMTSSSEVISAAGSRGAHVTSLEQKSTEPTPMPIVVQQEVENKKPVGIGAKIKAFVKKRAVLFLGTVVATGLVLYKIKKWLWQSAVNTFTAIDSEFESYEKKYESTKKKYVNIDSEVASHVKREQLLINKFKQLNTCNIEMLKRDVVTQKEWVDAVKNTFDEYIQMARMRTEMCDKIKDIAAQKIAMEACSIAWVKNLVKCVQADKEMTIALFKSTDPDGKSRKRRLERVQHILKVGDEESQSQDEEFDPEGVLEKVIDVELKANNVTASLLRSFETVFGSEAQVSRDLRKHIRFGLDEIAAD